MGRRVGLQFPKVFSPQEDDIRNGTIRTYADTHFERIDRPEPWCIAAYSLGVIPPAIDHCGFVLDSITILHILRQHSVVVVRLSNKVLAKKLEGYYRLCT
jgi:hypothetical protein